MAYDGDISDEVREFNDWFRMMFANQSKIIKHLRNDEEMYYGDVEETRSQFTASQLASIQEKYDIPISTKISWAICEQTISFLTGAKPYPRLVSSSEALQDYAFTYEKAISATWYESGMNEELTQTIRDMIVVGRGFARVRENNFFSESTFGVIGEYVDYRKVFIDPHSVKPDMSDAERICYADYITVAKAERLYGIEITETEAEYWSDLTFGMADTDVVTIYPYYSTSHKHRKDRKYVWIREYFDKRSTSVYLSENGDVSSKKPKPREIPNPDKEALGMQIQQMQAQLNQAVSQIEEMAANADESQQAAAAPGTVPEDGMGDMVQASSDYEQAKAAMDQQVQQFQQMQQAYAEMPDTIIIYDFETITGEKIEVREITKTVKKVIKRALLVGDKVIERNILPTDEYPIIAFNLNQTRRPDKVYGMMHFIKDMVKALNKFWALMIYDMQVNASRKVLAPTGTILDPTKVEQDWARPDSWVFYEPNPDLPNGGRPDVIPPSPLNPALVQMVQMVQSMIEYVTGISTVIQGQATSATPDSFGGIQTLQTFGTQRIKLYSRSIEAALEKFAYVMVCYLQAYAPKDEKIMYIDENGDGQELQIMSNNEDLRFKIRINMASNLPTQRHMAAQLLGVISGQTKNPHVADLLTQYALRYTDMPEGQKIVEELDVVKNQASQLEQAGQQMQDLQAENQQLKQQMFQKDLELEKKLQEMQLKLEAKLAMQNIRAANTEQEVSQAMGTQPTPPEEQQIPEL